MKKTSSIVEVCGLGLARLGCCGGLRSVDDDSSLLEES